MTTPYCKTKRFRNFDRYDGRAIYTATFYDVLPLQTRNYQNSHRRAIKSSISKLPLNLKQKHAL